jgi:hypothetical protein
MERQRRANNPENYDAKGRVKKGRLPWKTSQRYRETRRQLATTERKLAAHRKSLHGRIANRIIRAGNHIQIEKTSFKGWQKLFGKSIGLRAPGMFYEHLKRIVAKTGGSLREVGTYTTKLSQYCHGCQTYQHIWEGAEPRLRAEMERLQQRANAGESFPQSVGITSAGARRLKSPSSSQQEPILSYRRGRWEALGLRKEPPCL